MNLDWLIFGILWQALSMGVEHLDPSLVSPQVLIPLSLVASVLYFVCPTKVGGQTLGKKLLSIKVVSHAEPSARLTWGSVFVREVLGKTLSSLPLGLGYLWACFPRQHRTWHDMLSDTQVVSLVWEQEKSTAQKLQQVLLAVISVPAGVALILGIFLYTSLPLNSIKEKIEASGIQVGSLSGSLGTGLRLTEMRRTDQDPPFSLSMVEVKFNLWSLVAEEAFAIDKIMVEQGQVEVSEDFSFGVIFSNVLSLLQSPAAGVGLRNFTLGKLHFKNIRFENHGKVITHLQDFSLRSLALVDKEFYVSEVLFQIEGLKFKANEVKSSFGRVEIGNIVGGVTPEYLPLLKVPVDFSFKGSLGKSARSTKLKAGLMIDKIRIDYDSEKLVAFVDKLILNEMFKTAVPIEELDMKLSTQGKTLAEMFAAMTVEYRVKVCGQEFLPDPELGAILKRTDRQFDFSIKPLPVVDLSQVVFSPQASLEDLFSFQIRGRKTASSPSSPSSLFGSAQEMLADLCFQKPYSQLQALELEILPPLEKIVSHEEELLPSPRAVSSLEPLKQVLEEAKRLLKQGQVEEAKKHLQQTHVMTEGVAPDELGAYYNMKAWLSLYTQSPAEAVGDFEKAFGIRKDIRDAEGLLRANEALKKDQEAQKWLEYIKAALQENPDLKNQLTPNLQKKLSSEASEESPQ